MDFTPILQAVLDQLWFLAPVFVMVVLLKSARFKGWVGEAMVNLSARLFLDRKTYHLIRNVTLLTEDGTTQIDHIIVSPYGVFVVETKNMKGWIFGVSGSGIGRRRFIGIRRSFRIRCIRITSM